MLSQQILELMTDFWASTTEIFWFFITSVLIASSINALNLDRKVVHFFERAGIWSIVGALLLGIVSPL